MEGTGTEEGVKGIERKSEGGRESGEAYNVTSKSSMDEDGLREGGYP